MRMSNRRVSPEQKAASRLKSNANLKKTPRFKSGEAAPREAGSKGGKKSGLKRQEARTVRELTELFWGSRPVITSRIRDILINSGYDPDKDEITNGLVTVLAIGQKGQRGDARAYEKMLEIMGQDPKTLLEQKKLEIAMESLQGGASGYSALDEAFAKLNDGSGEP